MADPVSVVLVGIGGYGRDYVAMLLDETPSEAYRIVGVVDPLGERSDAWPRLSDMGILRHNTMEEFYAGADAELAIISSPIHFHCPQTCTALAHGSHVLCEKPIAATIQEARSMADARDAAERLVAIGYNWSFSPEIQALKADILSGAYGQPVQLKTLVLSPRDEAYYGRNDWAGVLQMPTGEWVLDSPINNATSHYLHNMLYLIGDAVDRSARPASVTAELYRANNIQSFDTGAARIYTDAGVEILFYSSHAVPENLGVRFLFEFEKASVYYTSDSPEIIARFHDVHDRTYPVTQGRKAQFKKLWDMLESVRIGRRPVCGIEAASAHTLCVNGMHDSMPEIVQFPASSIQVTGEAGHRVTWVEGLAEELRQAYEAWALPSEWGISWAASGRTVDLSQYQSFPGG